MLRTIVLLAQVLLLAQVTSGLAADGVGPFDGQWTGSATPTVQKCKQGNVTVTVEGTTVIGQAQFANDAPTSTEPSGETAGLARRLVGNRLLGSLARMGSRERSKTVTVNGKCVCSAVNVSICSPLLNGPHNLRQVDDAADRRATAG